ncbi:MAG: flavodoxin [Pseudomonadota bacterium]
MPSIAVVYYSLTGTTRAAAERVAEITGADLFEIRDARPRRGVLGVLRALWEVLAGRPPRISPPPVSPELYDAVVLACPVWAARPASPLPAWIDEVGGLSRPIGLLATLSSEAADGAFARLEDALCRSVVAKAAITDKDRAQGVDDAKLEAFARAVIAATKRREAAAPMLRVAASRSA